jgi:hypothetical protein
MLWSRAADSSIEALRRPVEAIILRPGSCSITLRGNGVRSRITQMASKGSSRATTSSGSLTWSVKTVISALPATRDQSANVSATFW